MKTVAHAILYAVLITGSGAGASIPHDELTTAVASSIAAGADYLLMSINETNGWTFVLRPPEVPHGSTAVRLVTNTYSEVEVTYRYETRVVYYEEYETQVQRPSDSSGTPGTIETVKKRRRINSPAEARNPRYVTRTTEHVRHPEGPHTRTTTTLRRDPDGPITRVHTVRRAGVADFWPTGFLGQNAMALLALLKSGVPETHEAVDGLIVSLTQALQGYGEPDTTWDLAWLAAAFSHVENPDHHARRDSLLNKLLDGQITTRPARGLWGPVCINMEMLGLFLSHYHAVMAQGQGRPHADREWEIIQLGNLGRRIAQQGIRFSHIQQWYELGLNEWNVEGRDVIIEGLPYSIYTETFADLESTAVALFALREAAARGVLPAETRRPDRAPGRERWPRGERVEAILERTAQALSQLQAPDGAWPEANIQQPPHPHRALQVGGMPAYAKLELPDERTAVSTAYGCAAIERLSGIVGGEAMRSRYGHNLALAYRTRVMLAERYLAESDMLEPPPFSHFLPESFVFNLTGFQQADLMSEERDRALWQQLAIRVIRRQTYNGDWPSSYYGDWHQSDRPYAIKSTSIWRQLEPRERERLANPPPRRRQPDPIDLPAGSAAFYSAWLANAFPRRSTSWWWDRHTQPVLMRESVIPTALAMLFLLDGLNAPPVAYLADETYPGPGRLLTTTIQTLRQRVRMELKPMRITVPDRSVVQGAPVVFIDKAELLDDAGVRGMLRDALASGAVLVMEMPASGPAAERVAALLPTARPAPLSDDFAPFAQWIGPRPAISAMLRTDGAPVVVWLPWEGPGALSGQDALQAAYLLLVHRASRAPLIPWALFDNADAPGPIVQRDRALAGYSRAVAGLDPRAEPPHEPPAPEVGQPFAAPVTPRDFQDAW